MTDAPLDPEQVAETRKLVAKERSGESVSDRYSAARLLQATVDLLDTVEALRERVERAGAVVEVAERFVDSNEWVPDEPDHSDPGTPAEASIAGWTRDFRDALQAYKEDEE